jgi:translation elongation factor P/translation initiation factor 5A
MESVLAASRIPTGLEEVKMVLASQLRVGMAIAFENQTYRVVAAEYHPGQGKMGGVMHGRLQNIDTGTFRELSFRAELKLQEMTVERQTLEFLYTDNDQCSFGCAEVRRVPAP